MKFFLMCETSTYVWVQNVCENYDGKEIFAIDFILSLISWPVTHWAYSTQHEFLPIELFLSPIECLFITSRYNCLYDVFEDILQYWSL